MSDRLRRLLAAAGALLLLAGCAGTEDTSSAAPTATPSQSLSFSEEETESCTFTLAYYPSVSLNPITTNNQTNLIVASLIYETMFTLDQNFEASANLCSVSAISEDGLTWTLTVNGGRTFSDGTAVTADDVVYSLNLARQADSLYAARLGAIQSVQARDGTVVIALSAPNGALDCLLDIPVIRETGGNPLGSGPYMLTETGESAALTLNPHWTQGDPETLPFESVELYPITETNDLLYGFDSGEISLVNTDFTGVSALGYSGDCDMWEYPTTVMQYVGCNTKTGFCRDASLRAALACLVDRTSIVTALLSRHADAAAWPASPRSGLYDTDLSTPPAYDLQKVETMLSEAGYTLSDGILYSGRSPVELTLLVNSGNTFKTSVASYLAESLAKAGIQVTVDARSWDSYNAALQSGDFDLYLAEVKLTADFDITPLVGSTGSLNYGGYSSAETDSLLSAFRSARGTARTTAAVQLYEQLSADAPVIPLCFKTHTVLTHWGMVEGVTPTQQNLFYRLTDWTCTPSAGETEE